MTHSFVASSSAPQTLSPLVPAEIAHFLGAPPLLPGEDSEAYRALTAEVAQALCPRDIIEWFWVKDVVDNAWETARLRRMRTNLISHGRALALGGLLRGHNITAFKDVSGAAVSVAAVVEAYIEGDPLWVERVDKALADRGMGREAIEVQAYAHRVEHIGALERMIAASDARRDAVLREIDRRRATRRAETPARAEGLDFGPPYLTPADFK